MRFRRLETSTLGIVVPNLVVLAAVLFAAQGSGAPDAAREAPASAYAAWHLRGPVATSQSPARP